MRTLPLSVDYQEPHPCPAAGSWCPLAARAVGQGQADGDHLNGRAPSSRRLLVKHSCWSTMGKPCQKDGQPCSGLSDLLRLTGS
jgi:hypothetical protein